MGAFPVDRQDRQQAVNALNAAATTATNGILASKNICVLTLSRFEPTDKTGEALVISPEGTRSKTGLLLPFKKGPFHIWDDKRIPIIPMVING